MLIRIGEFLLPRMSVNPPPIKALFIRKKGKTSTKHSYRWSVLYADGAAVPGPNMGAVAR